MTEFKNFPNGFEYIEVTNRVSSAKIALQGAHLFEYKCAKDEELLWCSSLAEFQANRPIRGGIPICWPWFGPRDDNLSLAQHGFARTSNFSFVSSQEKDDETTIITLQLTDTPQSRLLWNFKFELLVTITISKHLHVELKTTNLDSKEFKISQALHTYFGIKNILDAKIFGIKNRTYYNTPRKTNNFL